MQRFCLMRQLFPFCDRRRGGDSSVVQDKLKHVQQISSNSSTQNAFAAILASGNVVTWGFIQARQLWRRDQNPRSAQECAAGLRHRVCFCCFESGRRSGDLQWVATAPAPGNNLTMFSRSSAAQLLSLPFSKMGAYIVTWGNPREGGDSSSVQNEFSHI